MNARFRIPRYQKVISGVLIVSILMAMLAAILCMFLFAEETTPEKVNAMSTPAAADRQAYPTANIRNPDSEVRGVWIASVLNINFPSKAGLSADVLKAELEDIVGACVGAGLNAIYFQVRPTGDALYDSEIFPVSDVLVKSQDDGLPGGFDPLEYLVDVAHQFNIAVHAWVNPLRITSGTAANPKTDPNALGKTNPARLHPEWTVGYADGKLYYNAGIPEVRKLIADGCEELVRNYNIDGIVFDDYFYPYPVSGAAFADSDTFKTYGGDFREIGDWRRDNINRMVEGCYDAIKAVDKDCQFGIAPFGIWQNDDGKNGGSATKGMNAYSSLYADARAWIEGGYIDYIAPQLYWQFTTEVARYDELCRWWNALCDGTGVDLLISHAAYKMPDWGGETEIQQQVEFARSELNYRGSIFYGFASIKNNEGNLLGQLENLYSREIIYTDIASDGSDVVINSPKSGAYVNAASTYVLGSSDPGMPLYLDGKKVSRTKSGYFALVLPLKSGKNTFVFSQNGKDTEYIIHRGSAPAGKTSYDMDSFAITSVTPANDLIIGPGETVSLKVTAPAGSTVTAKINGKTITLRQNTTPTGKSEYLAAGYTGSYVTPAGEKNTLTDLGDIVFTASLKGESAEKTGGNLKVIGAGAQIPVEVVRNDTELKVSPNSWYYDDYTPAAAGMRDYATRLEGGFYKLRMGGYLTQSGAKLVENAAIAAAAKTADAKITDEGKHTVFRIRCEENVPLNGYVEDGKFIMTLYNTGNAAGVTMEDNPLFTAVTAKAGARANSWRYVLTLADPDNFYGFSFSYADGWVTASFRNPSGLAEGDKPLAGRIIALDAGHGGGDSGARGGDTALPEKEQNLLITLRLADVLTGLGAEVLLTRTDDSTVEIAQRLEMLGQWEPDLVISVHQNSLDYSADITHVRGLLGLYFADAGRLLSRCVADEAAGALNRYSRGAQSQRLALVRNPKFPSVLVEVGFITCPEEYQTVSGEAGIEQAAHGIAQGILAFYREQERFLD